MKGERGAGLVELSCVFKFQGLGNFQPHRSQDFAQGALKGTNLRGQTEPFRRFSLIFADSRLFLENQALGKRRFSQETADFRRKLQKTAGTRRLAFVPLGSSP